MNKQKKASKGLIALVVTLVVLLFMVWGFIIMLIFTSNENNDNNLKAMKTEEMAKTENEKKLKSANNNDEVETKIDDEDFNDNEIAEDEDVAEPENKVDDFEFSNVSFNEEFGMTEVIGEVRNNTSRTRSITFSVNLYDDNGKLLTTTPGIVSDIPSGGMKVFSTYFMGEYTNGIKYSIQVNNTL